MSRDKQPHLGEVELGVQHHVVLVGVVGLHCGGLCHQLRLDHVGAERLGEPGWPLLPLIGMVMGEHRLHQVVVPHRPHKPHLVQWPAMLSICHLHSTAHGGGAGGAGKNHLKADHQLFPLRQQHLTCTCMNELLHHYASAVCGASLRICRLRTNSKSRLCQALARRGHVRPQCSENI